MAKKSKAGRQMVTLECTEAKEAGVPVSRYSTFKNKTNSPDRIELKKYNPWMRRHTLHREIR